MARVRGSTAAAAGGVERERGILNVLTQVRMGSERAGVFFFCGLVDAEVRAAA